MQIFRHTGRAADIFNKKTGLDNGPDLRMQRVSRLAVLPASWPAYFPVRAFLSAYSLCMASAMASFPMGAGSMESLSSMAL